MNLKQITAGVTAATMSALALADGPSAGDLSAFVPDAATILTAIGAVGLVMLGVQLAIVGYRKVKGIVR